MRFIEKAGCKLSVCHGSVNVLGPYKIKSIFQLMSDYAADSFTVADLFLIILKVRVAINVRSNLKHFWTIRRSNYDFFLRLIFYSHAS